MDSNTALQLWLLLSLLLHGAVSLLYAALQNSSHTALRSRAEAGDATAQRYLSLRDASLPLSMSISVTHILTRFAVAVALALLLVPLAQDDLSLRLALALAAVLLGTLLSLLLGDILPEAIGANAAESLLPLALGGLRLLQVLVLPLTALVLLLSRLVARIFGTEPLSKLVTEEEIMTLVQASHSGGIIEAEEKDMIASVLQLGENSARELMTPRIDIVAIAVDDSMLQALATFVNSGFSRIPVYQDSIDQVVGLLYAKDILVELQKREDWDRRLIRDLVRAIYVVPETKRADALLKELQAKNVHLAIVVDEYGGTSGLITIENIIEEIVGDIRDEYDKEEALYSPSEDGSYIINASMDLDDLNNLFGCAIDTRPTDTLGGYIYLALGRVPHVDETIHTDILSMTVISIDGHRIRKVKVRRRQQDSAEAPLDIGDTQPQPAPGK